MHIKLFSFKRFCSSLLQAFGVLWLMVEVAAFFFSDQPWANTIKSYWCVFLIAGFVIGLYRAWPRLYANSRISETDIEVEVRVGNLFSSNGALIIGSNSTFDTAIEDKTISAESIQGQFTSRYCRSITELDQKLEIALKSGNSICVLQKVDKAYGKTDEYELGTVAPIEINGKKAYFVAIAKLNEHRVAYTDRNDFLDSLPKMWACIRDRGGFEPLCCPILGSGFSRLNLTREELLQEIIKSFVAASVEAKFSEKLTLFIHSKDFCRGHLDLNRIERFLNHQCVYARSFSRLTNRGPIGTGMS